MKQPKKATRNLMELMIKLALRADSWMIVECKTEEQAEAVMEALKTQTNGKYKSVIIVRKE